MCLVSLPPSTLSRSGLPCGTTEPSLPTAETWTPSRSLSWAAHPAFLTCSQAVSLSHTQRSGPSVLLSDVERSLLYPESFPSSIRKQPLDVKQVDSSLLVLQLQAIAVLYETVWLNSLGQSGWGNKQLSYLAWKNSYNFMSIIIRQSIFLL